MMVFEEDIFVKGLEKGERRRKRRRRKGVIGIGMVF